MIALEMITDVRQELLEITANFWGTDELLRLMNRGLAHYSGQVHLRETSAFLSTTDGEAEYTLPSNALSVVLVMYKIVANGKDTWRAVDASTLQEISRVSSQFLNNSTERLGTPALYAVWDRKIRLEPIPKDSTSSNLFIFFKARIPKVNNTGESIPLDESLTEAIHEYMLWKAWKKEKELDLAKDAQAEYEKGIREGRRFIKKQAESTRNRLDIHSNISFSRLVDDRFNPLA